MKTYRRGNTTIRKAGFLRNFQNFLRRDRLGELLVMKGLISADQLRDALRLQRETKYQLGQIFIHHNMISRPQLALVLSRQVALRILAGLFFFSFTFTGGIDKSARAGVKDVPAQIALTSVANASFGSIDSYPDLFGTAEKRSANISPFTKWTGMFARFDRELQKESNNRIISKWTNDLQDFKDMPLKSMADRVNTMVNGYKYILDKNNWGKSDYWATPVEFLQRGGDCEDFAIAKYTALRALGVPEERLRVAIVHDNLKNIPHAVLVVYTDQGTYILDNQNDRMVDGDNPGRYRPIFSINRHAWWLHTSESATIVASAR